MKNLTEGALRRLTAILDWRQQAVVFEQLVRSSVPICPPESTSAGLGGQVGYREPLSPGLAAG